MFKKSLFLSLLILIFVLQAKDFGKVTEISGKVYIKEKGFERKIKKGKQLKIGMSVRTHGKNSRVVILTADKNKLFIGPDSTLVLNENIINKRNTSSYNFSLLRGSLRSKINKFKRAQDSFNIYTPTIIAAVRGTDFSVAVGLDCSSIVQVEEGSVSVLEDDNEKILNQGDMGEALLGEEINTDKNKNNITSQQWLKKRRKSVSESPLAAISNMEKYLWGISEDLEDLVNKSENISTNKLPPSTNDLRKTREDALILSREYIQKRTANEGILNNSRIISIVNRRDENVRERAKSIQRINETALLLDRRIVTALRELDLRLEKAFNRLDSSFKEGSKKIDSLIPDKK